MADSLVFRAYAQLPVTLQNVACTLAGIRIRRERYNRVFRDALELLGDSQWWSLEEQRAYQNEQLRQVIARAYEHVPYYREVFDARGLTPADIQTVEDLVKLPILTKQIVRERNADLRAGSWPGRRLVKNHTGGTTGTAIQLVENEDTQPWQWAVWWRHRRRFGADVPDPFIVFAGRNVVPLSRMKPPIWRRNFAMSQTYVSIHHMLKQNMPALVDYLQTRRVSYYSGYPSGLYLLATHLLDAGIRLAHPPALTFTGAETLLPHQRRTIEKAFETRVSDQYGASEHVGNISECEHHTYHVDMEFGAVEFLPLPGFGSKVCRIVCTAFKNPVMPLIRYDIGDIATLSGETCPCGRQSPAVTNIDGRIESYIVTPDGRQLGRLDFLFKDSNRIEEAQLVQETLDRLSVFVVRSPGYDSSDERSLNADLRSYLGDQIRIDIEYVPKIPREPNGKFRQIVSRVFQDRYADVSHVADPN
jgi:phenylacetate-CoA ligase